jgi:Trp operon repressor
MNKHLETLMQKEMTRREFLTALGLGVATVMGFGSIIRLLSGKHSNTMGGYGSSGYGR